MTRKIIEQSWQDFFRISLGNPDATPEELEVTRTIFFSGADTAFQAIAATDFEELIGLGTLEAIATAEMLSDIRVELKEFNEQLAKRVQKRAVKFSKG